MYFTSHFMSLILVISAMSSLIRIGPFFLLCKQSILTAKYHLVSVSKFLYLQSNLIVNSIKLDQNS